jgi:hypothetical protein
MIGGPGPEPLAAPPVPPTPTDSARSTALLHTTFRLRRGVLTTCRVRVAARINSTAAPSWSSATAKMNDSGRGVEKVHELYAPTFAERQDVSSRRGMRPIDGQRCSLRFGLKVTHCRTRCCIAAEQASSRHGTDSTTWPCMPPGRGRPAMKPWSKGSATRADTIGIVRVPRCSAAVAGEALLREFPCQIDIVIEPTSIDPHIACRLPSPIAPIPG